MLLKDLERDGVAYEAFEIRDSETFNPSRKANHFRVNAARLATMIESRQQSLERLYVTNEWESDENENE